MLNVAQMIAVIHSGTKRANSSREIALRKPGECEKGVDIYNQRGRKTNLIKTIVPCSGSIIAFSQGNAMMQTELGDGLMPQLIAPSIFPTRPPSLLPFRTIKFLLP